MKHTLGTALFYLSYFLALGFWLFCLTTALNEAGIAWTVVGILLAGVGVVFVAVIALLIKGFLLDAGILIAGAVGIVLVRTVGVLLKEKQWSRHR